jgi:hypothetical protein
VLPVGGAPMPDVKDQHGKPAIIHFVKDAPVS